ncbi:hypothetical protein E2C01_015569 [Portunus trituberculatus]|uniref:Uncharacterized protein n=1 Tax=Portunus trituberculatus TaxID=210409 RepID=A0A5B7DND8_PORTR|nr:hypothetical protein [Portunus trituberculatus]
MAWKEHDSPHILTSLRRQRSGGGVSCSDGGRAVMANSGKFGAHHSVCSNVAQSIDVAFSCKYRQQVSPVEVYSVHQQVINAEHLHIL